MIFALLSFEKVYRIDLKFNFNIYNYVQFSR